MREFELLSTMRVWADSGETEFSFITMQLSFSTADIEKSVFFAPEQPVVRPSEQPGKITIFVAHRDVGPLPDVPSPVTPLPLEQESQAEPVIEPSR